MTPQLQVLPVITAQFESTAGVRFSALWTVGVPALRVAVVWVYPPKQVLIPIPCREPVCALTWAKSALLAGHQNGSPAALFVAYQDRSVYRINFVGSEVRFFFLAKRHLCRPSTRNRSI
jgi:hypothetical protein